MPPPNSSFALALLGLSSLAVVLLLSILFIAVDLVWPSTAFGQVLTLQTWQVINYVVNGLFILFGLVYFENLSTLYGVVHARIIAHSREGLAARWLGDPGWSHLWHAVIDSRSSTPSRGRRPKYLRLVLVCLASLLAGGFNSIASVLIDFKLVSFSQRFAHTAANMTGYLPGGPNSGASLDPSPTNYAVAALLLEQYGAILSTITPALLSPLCGAEWTGGCRDAQDEYVIHFGATTWRGNSSYGFPPLPQIYFNTTDPLTWELIGNFDGAGFAASRTLYATRTGFALTTDFACSPLPLTNNVVTIATNVSSIDGHWTGFTDVTQYQILVHDSPCATSTGNYGSQLGPPYPNISSEQSGDTISLFLSYEDDYRAYFDARACTDDKELMVLLVGLGGMEYMPDLQPFAYSCTSQVLQWKAQGNQSSDGFMSVELTPGTAIPADNGTLQQWTTQLKSFFGWGSGDPDEYLPPPFRPQGGWAVALDYGFTTNQTQIFINDTWRPEIYLESYCNALLASFGTVFSAFALSGINGTDDVIVREAIRLGLDKQSLAFAVPLLVLLVFLFAAESWLVYELYPGWRTKSKRKPPRRANALPVLKPSDLVAYLSSTDVRALEETDKLYEVVSVPGEYGGFFLRRRHAPTDTDKSEEGLDRQPLQGGDVDGDE